MILGVKKGDTMSNSKENNTKIEIMKILHKMGIPVQLKGYRYLRSAVECALYHPEYIENVTKCLYPHIARQHHTTASRVERAIRHAIEVAKRRGNENAEIAQFWKAMFYIDTKPTNVECIAMITEVLYIQNLIE